jgi:hypothetical protein
MKSQGFPNCCTAKILSDFGGTPTTGGQRRAASEDEMTAWVKQRMQYVGRGQVFVVITNSDQDIANRVLRQLGFSSSKWMRKAQHPQTKMRLWWKQAGVPYLLKGSK